MFNTCFTSNLCLSIILHYAAKTLDPTLPVKQFARLPLCVITPQNFQAHYFSQTVLTVRVLDPICATKWLCNVKTICSVFMCAMPLFMQFNFLLHTHDWTVTLSKGANILQSEYVAWWKYICLTAELWNAGMDMFRENVFDWPQPPDHTKVSTGWHTDGKELKVWYVLLVFQSLFKKWRMQWGTLKLTT